MTTKAVDPQVRLGPAPDLAAMGPAQQMVLLEQVLAATTERLAQEFGADAKTMALVLGSVHSKWVMSIGTDVCLS